MDTYLSYYSKKAAIPMIIDILSKEGVKITEDNVKVWSSPRMRMSDIVNGCLYVKNDLKNPILVYTNNVPHRDAIAKDQNVTIFDNTMLKELALKHKNYKLYDMLSYTF